MEKIYILPEHRKALVDRYGAVNVSRALNYQSNSLMSREIRVEAINKYKGIYIKD